MAARKSPVRAVEPGELAPPTSIEEAVRRGDELAVAQLTRMGIAQRLDSPECPARDMASLSKRLMELGREIASIEALRAEEAGKADEVTDSVFDATAV